MKDLITIMKSSHLNLTLTGAKSNGNDLSIYVNGELRDLPTKVFIKDKVQIIKATAKTNLELTWIEI